MKIAKQLGWTFQEVNSQGSQPEQVLFTSVLVPFTIIIFVLQGNAASLSIDLSCLHSSHIKWIP